MQEKAKRSSGGAPVGETYSALGRLRVTISDLEVLLAKLRKTYKPEYIVLHAGRVIESPDDLRAVSDTDLRNLSITVMNDPSSTRWAGRTASDLTNDDLVVLLRINEAAAVGVLPLVLMVEDWARTRQFVGLPPRTVLGRRKKSTWKRQIVLVFLGLLQMVSIFVSPPSEHTAAGYVSAGTCILFLALFAWFFHRWFTEPARVRDFTLVVPLTLDEFRKEEVVRKRYYITTAIAIGAPLVATITALVIALIKT
ncbi:hypothetical protein ACFOSH_14365 [Amycolatopsis speibonae]|uniref:Ubiquitin-like domain-containing protein n=1 Tax=Amycolatopsis speibonae TaxID=1450224 RepID=A0ABV7NY68_9PSEU